MDAKKKETILFVRAQPDLVQKLTLKLQEQRQKEPGRRISRSDLIRNLLYATLDGPSSQAE